LSSAAGCDWGITINGCVPVANSHVSTNQANTRLTKIPPSNMMIFRYSFALIKLSGALKSSVSAGSSPLSLTNPPSGIQLRVYSVQDASVQRVIAFGGIHTPNSKTLTQAFFAVKKCHSSWIITKNINESIPITTQIIVSAYAATDNRIVSIISIKTVKIKIANVYRIDMYIILDCNLVFLYFLYFLYVWFSHTS